MKEILEKVTAESTIESLINLQHALFDFLEQKRVRIKKSEPNLPEDEIYNRLVSPIINTELNVHQKQFLSLCLWSMDNYEQLLKAKMTEKKQEIMGKFPHNVDQQGTILLQDEQLAPKINDAVDDAYLRATSFLRNTLQKFCEQQAPQLESLNNYDIQDTELITSRLSWVIESSNQLQLSSIAIKLQLEKHIVQLTVQWDKIRNAFNAWARSGKKEDLQNTIKEFFKLNQLVHGLSAAVCDEYGSEDKSTAFSLLKAALIERQVNMDLTPLISSRMKDFRDLMDMFVSLSNRNNYTTEDVKSFLTQEGNSPEIIATATNILAEFSGMVGPSLVYFIQDNANAFQNYDDIRPSNDNNPLKKSALKILIDIAKSQKSVYLALEIAEDVLTKKASVPFQEDKSKPVRRKSVKNKAVEPNPDLGYEQQASIRHQIELEKYTLNYQETKLLATAVGDKSLTLLIPERKNLAHQPPRIKTYAEFITETTRKIQDIEQRNAQRWSFSPLRERTDHLKASVDFVQFLLFKHDTATKPQLFLSRNLHRNDIVLGNELLSKTLLIKPPGNVTVNVAKATTFKTLFNNAVSRLSFVFSDNRALKKLNDLYKGRMIQLNKEKNVTPNFPSKPADLSRVPRKKAEKLTQHWLREKGRRNASSLSHIQQQNSFTLFSPLTGALSSYPQKNLSIETIQKIDSYNNGEYLKQLVPKNAHHRDTLYALQDKLIQLYNKTHNGGLESDLWQQKHQSADEDIVNKTTVQSFENIVTRSESINQVIKKLKALAPQQDLHTLDDYYHIFLNQVLGPNMTPEEKFELLLKEVIKQNKEAATLFAQTEMMITNFYMPSNNELSDNLEIRRALYLEQLAVAKTLVQNNKHLPIDFETQSATTLKDLSTYVDTLETSLTNCTKHLPEISSNYFEHLGAEISARETLKRILNEIGEEEAANQQSKLIELLQSINDSIRLITYMSGPLADGNAKQIATSKLQLISTHLKQILDQSKTLEEVKNGNTEKLEPLKEEFKLETRLMPAVHKSLKITLDNIKYQVAHTTQHFGLQN